MKEETVINSITRTFEEMKNYRFAILQAIDIENITVTLPNSFETKSLRAWEIWAKDNIEYGNYGDVSLSAMNILYTINNKIKNTTQIAINAAFGKVNFSIQKLGNELIDMYRDNLEYRREVDEYLQETETKTYNAFQSLLDRLELLMKHFIGEVREKPEVIEERYRLLLNNIKGAMETEKKLIFNKVNNIIEEESESQVPIEVPNEPVEEPREEENNEQGNNEVDFDEDEK